MSLSQITIASLMIGAPTLPAVPQPLALSTHPESSIQLEYQLPLDGQGLVSAENEQPTLFSQLQIAEPTQTREENLEYQSPDSASNELETNPIGPEDGGPDEDVSTIIVSARPETPTDPLMELNADTFDVVQDVDQAFVEPVAMAYKKTLPAPIRDGLRNFISNLGEPIVFLNYLLQLKPGKAFETLGRFTINTTIGIGGLIDVAKKPPFHLPRRSNGFANTMGYYGIKPGPFLFLPLVGPTTVRDLIGNGLNLLVLPNTVGKPFTEPAITIPGSVISSLNSRIAIDEQLTAIREGDADPYTAAREFYLNKRQREIDILRGRIPDPLSRKSKRTLSTPQVEAQPAGAAATSPVAPEVNADSSNSGDELETKKWYEPDISLNHGRASDAIRQREFSASYRISANILW
ncbi:MlaA family lipoprotein [Parasphingorhabdus sp.]|uniref:MlaA family lipoprotein n=1 Tax=Parasphingorhabdus sp. TaxID=2709688 RepID=UPI003D2828B2